MFETAARFGVVAAGSIQAWYSTYNHALEYATEKAKDQAGPFLVFEVIARVTSERAVTVWPQLK